MRDENEKSTNHNKERKKTGNSFLNKTTTLTADFRHRCVIYLVTYIYMHKNIMHFSHSTTHIHMLNKNKEKMKRMTMTIEVKEVEVDVVVVVIQLQMTIIF